ncbi:unnamed protein product [Calypogeia fissa]
MASLSMVSSAERMGSILRFYPFPKSLRSSRPVARSVSFTPPRSQVDLRYQVEKSMYKYELEAALEVVERACRLCISVQEGLKAEGENSGLKMEFEKSDASPVTVADLGVQALVSLGLSLGTCSLQSL